MLKRRTGHLEQLPSGAYRAVVYLGTNPVTRRQQYLKSGSVETEDLALIGLGKPLEQASEGQGPETGATVAQLLDEYCAVAGWDVTTRATNERFIRCTIKPPLGYRRVREVRGPATWMEAERANMNAVVDLAAHLKLPGPGIKIVAADASPTFDGHSLPAGGRHLARPLATGIGEKAGQGRWCGPCPPLVNG